MESEEIVLTYKSATLRKKDISFLNDGNWLNDQVINFYYEYLASNLSVDATDEDKRIGKRLQWKIEEAFFILSYIYTFL